jgi:hypothetical protein
LGLSTRETTPYLLSGAIILEGQISAAMICVTLQSLSLARSHADCTYKQRPISHPSPSAEQSHIDAQSYTTCPVAHAMVAQHAATTIARSHHTTSLHTTLICKRRDHSCDTYGFRVCDSSSNHLPSVYAQVCPIKPSFCLTGTGVLMIS